jgi:hypothetical protein
VARGRLDYQQRLSGRVALRASCAFGFFSSTGAAPHAHLEQLPPRRPLAPVRRRDGQTSCFGRVRIAERDPAVLGLTYILNGGGKPRRRP